MSERINDDLDSSLVSLRLRVTGGTGFCFLPNLSSGYSGSVLHGQYLAQIGCEPWRTLIASELPALLDSGRSEPHRYSAEIAIQPIERPHEVLPARAVGLTSKIALHDRGRR